MTWTQELRQSVTDISQIQRKLGLSAAELAQLQKLCAQFPMSVPQYYLDLINWNDPSDPIRKMCIPTFFEADSSGTFDTSGEVDNTVCVGVQHKYRESALILTTNRCAMYCRHCFRKRQVGLSDEEIAHHFFDVVCNYSFVFVFQFLIVRLCNNYRFRHYSIIQEGISSI